MITVFTPRSNFNFTPRHVLRHSFQPDDLYDSYCINGHRQYLTDFLQARFSNALFLQIFLRIIARYTSDRQPRVSMDYWHAV